MWFDNWKLSFEEKKWLFKEWTWRLNWVNWQRMWFIYKGISIDEFEDMYLYASTYCTWYVCICVFWFYVYVYVRIYATESVYKRYRTIYYKKFDEIPWEVVVAAFSSNPTDCRMTIAHVCCLDHGTNVDIQLNVKPIHPTGGRPLSKLGTFLEGSIAK